MVHYDNRKWADTPKESVPDYVLCEQSNNSQGKFYTKNINNI